MPGPFSILQLRTDSPQVIEQLGSKPKFWFRIEGDAQPWLFKFTREHTGEDWSEKIASEVAVVLGVPAAKVELAEFMGKRGCASRSFVRTKKGFDLIHGSEVLAGRVFGYEKLKRRSEEHTSEIQSQFQLVNRLLLEKKKKIIIISFLHNKKKKFITHEI